MTSTKTWAPLWVLLVRSYDYVRGVVPSGVLAAVPPLGDSLRTRLPVWISAIF